MPSDFALLRLYLADPITDAEGNEIVPFLSQDVLATLMDEAGDDIHAAASAGWQIKAARASELVDTMIDGDQFSLSDLRRHAMLMVDLHGSLSGTGGSMVNIEMTTASAPSTTEGDDLAG